MHSKLSYLEGIRGVAALIVVFSHFLRVFYPVFFETNPSLYHGVGELFISSTPFNVIYNGYLSVCIFFILSGYVLSYRFFKTKDKSVVQNSFLRRYPRLAIPAFVSVLIMYVITFFDLSYFDELRNVASTAMDDPFVKDVNFFWMLIVAFFIISFSLTPSLTLSFGR